MAKKVSESVDNDDFRLKKLLSEISEAETAVSNYDLGIDFSFYRSNSNPLQE